MYPSCVMAPPAYLSALPLPTRFTEAEYFRMCDLGAFDGMRVDLVWGELERMAPSGHEHGGSLGDVAGELRAVIDRRRFRVLVDTSIQLLPSLVRAPDVAIVRLPLGPSRAVDAAAVVLAVEVADTSLADDLASKMRSYGQARIPNYWVVDVTTRVTHVHADPNDLGYASRRVVRFEEPLAVPEAAATISLG